MKLGILKRLFAISGFGWGGGDESAGALYKRSVSIAWPATIEGALLSIIGSIDTIMVGTLGSAALAAVGITTQPRMIMLILAQALCVGTTALIARRKGEGDRAAANSTLRQSMYIISGVGVVITLVGYFGAEPFLRLAGANDDTLEMAVSYFRVISLGFMFNCWSLCLCAGMRAIGQTRITMATNITANLVNVCLNYCLIGGNFGFPALGVRGAAIATVAGTGVSCAIAFWFASRADGYLRFTLGLPKFDRRTLSGLIKVGSSSVAESAFLRVGFLINTMMVARIGTAAMATYQIVQQVAGLSFTLGDGIAAAGTTLVGQSLGAGRKDLAMANVKISRKLSIVTSVALMLVIFLTRRQLAGLFSDEANIIAGASLAFLVVITGVLPQNGRVVFSGCLRGAGDVRYVAMCSLISVTLLRPIFTYVFCYPLNAALPALSFAVTGPWISFVLDAYIREALLYRRVKRGKWLELRL